MAKNYTAQERKELDRMLESMTQEELDALESKGRKLINKATKTAQAEYNRRYRRRIALAHQLKQQDK